MVKRKSKGSLLGRSSSGSKDKTGLYLVSIVAIVAVVSLFLMMKGGSSQAVNEDVVVVDDIGNLVGEATYDRGVKYKKSVLSGEDLITVSVCDTLTDERIDAESVNCCTWDYEYDDDGNIIKQSCACATTDNCEEDCSTGGVSTTSTTTVSSKR